MKIPSAVTRVSRGFQAAVCLSALALSLTACGGGGSDDEGPPPTISLGISTTTALRGEPIRLEATVSASNGVDHVNFFRVDFGTPVLLARFNAPPAVFDTSVPINAGGTTLFFAEACDLSGKCTDSPTVTVVVYP